MPLITLKVISCYLPLFTPANILSRSQREETNISFDFDLVTKVKGSVKVNQARD